MASLVGGHPLSMRKLLERGRRSRRVRRFRFGIEFLEDRITPASPTVTELSPMSGPSAGGTEVTIGGTNFESAQAPVVHFGASLATNITLLNNSTITADSPSGTGTVDVTVTTSDGTSPTSPADEFTYTTSTAPVVSGISPTSGPLAGGTVVTITGSGFTGVTAVDFGTVPGTSVDLQSDGTLTVVSPASVNPDTVDVTVTTPRGTSATTPADQFTYVAAPTVTNLSPNFGPNAGGTVVTITGTNFSGSGTPVVHFGSIAATDVTVVSGSVITAVSPAGTGTVDVTITTSGGTSPTSPADQFTYKTTAAPVVSTISPTSGPLAGGTVVTITGTGFTGVTAVDFGTVAGTNLSFISDMSINVVSPPGVNPGAVHVTVTTPEGTSATSPADQFTYIAGPTVTGLSPNTGPEAGGTFVTISGTNFEGAGTPLVRFGTVLATSVTVVSGSVITAVSPAGTGTVDVTVMTPGGTSPTNPADQFTYTTSSEPVVSAISPTKGPIGGGTVVTITGTGFTGVTVVDFGTVAGTNLSFISDTSINVVSPPGVNPDTVHVTVTTPEGTSATSPADQFTYIAAPTVTGLSPNTGPEAGGTFVTISGMNFESAGTPLVRFGTVLATNVTVVSGSVITAVSPAGMGIVDVTVTTEGGTSATSPTDQFTYTAAAQPVVSGISPTSGPLAGGTLVTITGTGFTGVTGVDFGAVAGTDLTFISDMSITVLSPPSVNPDTVDVTVTTSEGTSATSPADEFTYVAAPTVSGLSPSFGPTAGGTVVTITGAGFTAATEVNFGTVAASNLTINSDSSISVDSPPGTGAVNVTVTTPGGTSAASAASVFTYTAPSSPPTVTAISPRSGPAAGGTLVTITGTGFSTSAPAAVYFGANEATQVIVVSATTITAVSSAGTGSVHVTVYTADGGSTNTPADVFTYTSDGPQVTSVVRYGYHSQPTYLVVYFNMALDPASAERESNYSVVSASGKTFKVKSARYNGTTDAVTLAFSQRLYLFTYYNFRINGTTASGVKNASGVLLDGANTGQPGSDYVTTIAPYALRGSASERPVASVLRAKVARLVDRVRVTLRPKRI